MSARIRFDGKVVLVTGAGRGLGRAYAFQLARRGAHVLVNDLGVDREGKGRSKEPAQAVVDEIIAEGGAASPDVSDVASPEEASALIDDALREYGRVDAVINNAGIFLPPKAFADTTLEEFERVWRNHCGGAYNICKAVLPSMLAANAGRIVNTCSIQGLYGAATSAAYASAKGAVQGLTLSIAAAVRGTGVGANAISPGGYTRMLEDDTREPAFVSMLQRNLDPDLAAPVALWLCHGSCTENGEIFQAYGGRVSRSVIGELDGFWNMAPTPETIASGVAAMRADGPVIRAPDSASRARAVFEEAEKRRATGGDHR
ncbi:SDR family NAD(P)-dependent oxidoreductase [Terricaulis silvestris]|uniref:Short-chain type dehydrogenase/reductase n=1 Tax=Terricaulis silvestris TaxID=2686094 RepID=A0A6I6MKT9_9CAUL|nr:SDR family NAD(P)-dependent oxidoreductase [Terricaulis silvestris]QGZ93776.1 Putative short-chain type dehydrogenase/reductase [Terricaulis silvestris]